jgi:hypothetical protein
VRYIQLCVAEIYTISVRPNYMERVLENLIVAQLVKKFRQMNSVHNITSHSSTIHFNTTTHLRLGCPCGTHPSTFVWWAGFWKYLFSVIWASHKLKVIWDRNITKYNLPGNLYVVPTFTEIIWVVQICGSQTFIPRAIWKCPMVLADHFMICLPV